MSEYIVTTADPEGYWLMPPESRDPDEWAWMEQADLAAEIRALRAENKRLTTANARLTVECEAWRDGRLFTGYERPDDGDTKKVWFVHGYPSKVMRDATVSRKFDTIDAAVDALCAEHAADALTAQAQADGLYDCCPECGSETSTRSGIESCTRCSWWWEVTL